MGRVLIVDDEPRVRQMLRRFLTGEGFDVESVGEIKQAQQAIRKLAIDIVLLDLKLGAENGLDFARELRREDPLIPIVILSSKDDVLDKVVGLEVGADDYIAKPFHLRELLARMRALLRRVDTEKLAQNSKNHIKSNTESLSFGNWRLERASRSVKSHLGMELRLTSQEFKLLDTFVRQPQRVLSRDQLLDQIANRSWTPYDRSIDSQVRRLRKKIEEDPGNPKLIKTVRGEGYMLAVDVRPETEQL